MFSGGGVALSATVSVASTSRLCFGCAPEHAEASAIDTIAKMLIPCLMGDIRSFSLLGFTRHPARIAGFRSVCGGPSARPTSIIVFSAG
jgi:hypothetical protein